MELVLDHITKYYGKNRALDDVCLKMIPGIYALLGPNGSGKSTMMNIITQNLRATTGRVLFDGEDTSKSGKNFRKHLGYMPQSASLYSDFKASEFLWYVAALKGIDKKTASVMIPQALENVELGELSNSKIRTFSGGMKQRLSLAQALLGNPDVIILDEPTAGLDPKQRIIVRNLISSISLQKIVLIATHVVSDVEVVASEVICLKKGSIINIGSPAQLSEQVYGKVWIVDTTEEEIEKYENMAKIINIQKIDNRVRIRMLSDSPVGKATLAEPGLEDFYLSVYDEF